MATQTTSSHSNEGDEFEINNFHDVFLTDDIEINEVDVNEAIEELNRIQNKAVEDSFFDSLSDLEDFLLDDDDTRALFTDNDTGVVDEKSQVQYDEARRAKATVFNSGTNISVVSTIPQDVSLIYQRQAPYSETIQNNYTLTHRHQQQQSTYVDYSRISDSEALSKLKSTSLRGKNQESFPMKLHKILKYSETNPYYASIISWLPHGRAFIIHDTTRFVSEIMPRYFFQTLWSSFLRQVNVYGFRKLTKGVDRGAYCHHLFLRGRSGLCVGMTRSKNKVSFDPRTEPNLYDMAFMPFSTAVPFPAPQAAAAVPSPRQNTNAAPSDLRRIHYSHEEDQEQQVYYVPQQLRAAVPDSNINHQANSMPSSQSPLVTIVFGSSKIKVTTTNTGTPSLSPCKRSASPDRKTTVKPDLTVDKKVRLSHHTLFYTFMMCLCL